MKITDSSKGSGYYDIRLEDNSVVRVQDETLPSGYVPTVGDSLKTLDGASIFIPAGILEEKEEAKEAKIEADQEAVAEAQAELANDSGASE